MPLDNQFQGDWNANKGYLQLMIDYMAMAGQLCIQEDAWRQYRTVREIYKLTNGVIDDSVAGEAKSKLDQVKDLLRPKNIDTRTAEGQSMMKNKAEQAETQLEEVEVALIAAIHKANLILPKKEQRKGVKQLWEEYGLDDDNSEEAGADNKAILPEAGQ